MEIAQSVARTRNIETMVLPPDPNGNFDESFRTLARRQRTGIVQLSAPSFSVVAAKFAEAAENSLAFITPSSQLRQAA